MASSEISLEESLRLLNRVVAKADVPHGAEREVEMAKRYILGETLDAIGKDYDLTRERVRQLINLSGWKTGELRRARKTIDAEERKKKTELDRERVLKWSYANPASSRQAAVEELQLPDEVISKLLGNRRNLHAGGRPRERKPVWSDSELIETLQEFHESTGSTVSMEFEKWSMARGGPSRQTPTIRFGSWSAALNAANIKGSYSVDRDRRHTDEDLWAAVVEFFSFDRQNYSYDAFGGWLSDQDGMPSAALIRVRLGRSWSELSTVGQKVASGRVSSFDSTWVQQVREQRNWSLFNASEPQPDIFLAEALSEIGPVVTIATYNAWAQKRDAPSAQTLMKRSGDSWVNLVEKAGGRTGTRGARGKASDQALLAPLAEFILTNPVVRYEAYSQWARANNNPVASTIVRRFGSWDISVAAARKEAARMQADSDD